MFEYYNKQECLDYFHLLELEIFNLLDFLHPKSYQIIRRQVYIDLLWYYVYRINSEEDFNRIN